jgi:predicted ATPase
MITNISIDNFKSLGSISFGLNKFNCFIGMNGAGKSTLLQALDFISHLMIGDVSEWLDSRGWTAQDLNSKFRKENNIRIAVMVLTADERYLVWTASFNRHDMRCSSEAIFCDDESAIDDESDPIFPKLENNVFRVTSQTYRVREQQKKDISFNYEGSILSQLRDAEVPHCVLEFRDMLRNVRSLELLSPHLMRKT